MNLRPATPSDVPVLRYWDTMPHVIAATGDRLDNIDDDFNWEIEVPRQVPWRELLIAEHNARPIGMVQIIDPAEEESHYWGDIDANLRAIDIWIGEPGDLGQGFGSQMMALAHARCFEPPQVTAVLIDPLQSNTRARKFYERLGYEFVENRRFGDDDCAVYRLSRERWIERR
jgi:aminoglycoside 6'-N-acetyltransferase